MKKNEELLRSIGDIDEKYIENAKPKNIQKKKISWISAVSAAACLIGTIGLMYYFVVRPINDINKGSDGNTESIPPQVSTDTVVTESLQTDKKDDLQIDKIDFFFDQEDVKEIDAICVNGEDIYLEVKETIQGEGEILSFIILDSTGHVKRRTDDNSDPVKYSLPPEYKSFLDHYFNVDEIKGSIYSMVMKEYDNGTYGAMINYDINSASFSEIPGEFNTITSIVSDNLQKIFYQKDRTALSVSDSGVYLYKGENIPKTKIFDLPEVMKGYKEDNVDLIKVNDNSYIYITGLTGPVSDTEMYRLTRLNPRKK